MKVQVSTRSGTVIAPVVKEATFDRLPIDGWYGGDRYIAGEWVPQERNPRPNLVWGIDGPVWLVFDDGELVGAFTDPLPGVRKVTRDSWNEKFRELIPDDPDAVVPFRY